MADIPQYDWSFLKGDTVNQQFQITQASGELFDFTGCVGKSQARANYTDVSESINFTVAFDADRTNGLVALQLPASQSAGVSAGQYHWDFQILSGSTQTTLIKGLITVDPEATQ